MENENINPAGQIVALEGQTLLDLALQTGGALDCLFDLALRNNISITDDLAPGQQLVSPAVIDRRVVDYYRTKNITPATALQKTARKGIGSMVIGRDFVVR